MNENNGKKGRLYFFLIVGIIGLFTSFYLIQNHYAPQKDSICDFGVTISCSTVNTSIFAELFNVPVAIFGAIWFVVLLHLAWLALTKNGLNIAKLYYWNVLGLIFIIYMILGEIVLKALCPMCTIVHIIVIATFLVSRKMYKPYRISFKSFLKKTRKFIIFIIIINLIPVLIFNTTDVGENYDVLAKCLNENGVRFYSSIYCGHCLEQKELFGDSFQYIEEIECHPDASDSQAELCKQMEIVGTPTWTMEHEGKELKRNVGYMSIEDIRNWAGCYE